MQFIRQDQDRRKIPNRCGGEIGNRIEWHNPFFSYLFYSRHWIAKTLYLFNGLDHFFIHCNAPGNNISAQNQIKKHLKKIQFKKGALRVKLRNIRLILLNFLVSKFYWWIFYVAIITKDILKHAWFHYLEPWLCTVFSLLRHMGFGLIKWKKSSIL